MFARPIRRPIPSRSPISSSLALHQVPFLEATPVYCSFIKNASGLRERERYEPVSPYDEMTMALTPHITVFGPGTGSLFQ